MVGLPRVDTSTPSNPPRKEDAYGVMAFMRTIAKEYGRYGIRANSVCPGLVLPNPDNIGTESLWQQDIGMGEREVANITSGIPLRATLRGGRHRVGCAHALFGARPPAHGPSPQRLQRLRHTSVTFWCRRRHPDSSESHGIGLTETDERTALL
jgi:hypothetical protein